MPVRQSSWTFLKMLNKFCSSIAERASSTRHPGRQQAIRMSRFGIALRCVYVVGFSDRCWERCKLLEAQEPQSVIEAFTFTLTLLAIIFFLREVEASTSRVSAWSFNDEAKVLTWNLPGSKSDHKALGVKRTWPCICGHKVVPCPYHLASLTWSGWTPAITRWSRTLRCSRMSRELCLRRRLWLRSSRPSGRCYNRLSGPTRGSDYSVATLQSYGCADVRDSGNRH